MKNVAADQLRRMLGITSVRSVHTDSVLAVVDKNLQDG